MKYRNPTVSKIKYGDEKKYHYSFYWKQAMSFYKAAKTLPMESVPLVSYYSMLNADYLKILLFLEMNFQLYMWDIKIKVFLSCLEECLSRTLILFGQAENQIQLH